MDDIKELSLLCVKHYGKGEWEGKKLKGEGSNRKYYRMTRTSDGLSCIGVKGENKEENEAFIYLSGHLNGKNLPVPAVLETSEDKMYYIQQDLGDMSLFQYISNGIKTNRFDEEEVKMLKNTMEVLPAIQFDGAQGLDFGKCYPMPEMDHQSIMWDLNYFKYCFLKLTKIDFSEKLLESDFAKLAVEIENEEYETFMYRDFQSRNVMICDGKPHMIDFQGGRRGPYLYDVASFVWQAKANYPASLKKELTKTYYKSLQKYKKIEESEFNSKLQTMVLFRTMQVLGAYGYRGLFERKEHFVQSIPYAIGNLRDLLNDGGCDKYEYLKQLLTRLTEMPELQHKEKKEQDLTKLTVKVYSFSYKKGIPEDDSGNGGGYVFDCRGVHNPGKYDQYKPLTGRDKPVIDFLEEDGEILTFLDSVYKLADAHVERYIERGFSSLMFSFGCTGGQHRSVYSAQHVAEHIAKKFGVKVILTHREQNINEIL